MENLRGSLFMVASMAGFALEDMFVKSLAARLPIGEVLIFLGAGGALIFAILAAGRGQGPVSPALFTAPVAIRNIGEILGTMCFISAIALTPLAQASAILQATPLAVTLGAALFLGEKVGWRRWTAIGVGFLGVMIVVRPGTDGFSALSLLAVGAVIALAARDVATRRVPGSVGSLQLATWGFASVVPAGAVMLIFGADPLVLPTLPDLGRLAGALLFGTAGYYALIAAMRIGEVAVITPFRYTRLVFALLVGRFVFGEPVDGATLFGGAVIVGSGLYALWRQAQLARAARQAAH